MADVSLGILHTRTNVSKSQAFESAGLAQSLIFMLALRLRGGKMRGASTSWWERKSVWVTSFAEIPSALLSDNRKQVPLNSPRWVITAVPFKNANYTVPRLRLEISQSQMKRENQNALPGRWPCLWLQVLFTADVCSVF